MVTRSSRGRRAAQPAASTPTASPPTRQRRRGPAKTVQRAGAELVGQLIDVSWPSDNTFYRAVVVEYDKKQRQHKVIYMEDETIELMELGSGPGLRAFKSAADEVDDPLIGAEVVLSDSAAAASASETWFDFMRDEDRLDKNEPFLVTIYQAMDDASKEDISGPCSTSNSDTRLYRVVHLPNDYVTTIDLACAEHKFRSKPNASPDDEGDASFNAEDDDEVEVVEDVDAEPVKDTKADTEDPDADVSADPTADTDAMAEPEPVPSVRSRSNRGRKPAKKVEVAPVVDVDVDDDAKPVDADPTASIRNDDGDDKEAVRDDDDYKPAGVDDSDEEPVKPSRSSQRVKAALAEAERVPTRGRGRRPATTIKVSDDDDIVADSLDSDLREIAAGGSGAGSAVKEEPGATRRKREKGKPPGPVPSALFPEEFNDEKNHDTASDEEKFGWVPSPRKDATNGDAAPAEASRAPENRPQVGDFLSLDTGSGGDRRKAFVEAYFPETGTHFVAFCDSRGGHQQIKLTNDNYSLISDAEVEKMTNNEAVLPVDDDDDDAIVVDEPRKTRSRDKGRAPTPKRERETPSGKGKKKVAKRYSSPKILGKSAAEEIVSRCVSVVWPGSKLVYVALVMGYSPESRQHILLYMVDHCVETLDLRYREWELLARGNEPWNSSGMVGKRIFVWWPGEYGEPETQELSERLFGDEPKVAYEAYVLSYIGKGVYKIIYPCNEDCENRGLKTNNQDASVLEKEWDLLEEGVMDVEGLPVIGWEG